MRIAKSSLLLLVISALIACSEGKKKEEVNEPEIKTVETKFEHKQGAIDASFNDEKLTAIFTEYIGLKTALVNTDSKLASQAASKLLTAFADQEVDETTMSLAQKIADAGDVEAQRSAFVGVTNAVEALLKDALDSGKVYKQYCPMAFKNTGAYWLSESKEIANPYFGDKMYRCGRIDSIIE